MKISLYNDGAVAIDGRLFDSVLDAELALRDYAKAPLQPFIRFAFELPHDYDVMGELLYAVHRLGFEHVDDNDDPFVEPRPTGSVDQ